MQDELRLTSSERAYVRGRLAADGIQVPEVWEIEDYEIPIIIADRSILALYEAADRRAAEILSERPARMIVNLPDEVLATGTPDAPTWQRANWRDLLVWFGVGSVAGFAVGLAAASVVTWVALP